MISEGNRIRVGVLGALGRMGREVCRAVASEPDLRLAAAVDVKAAGENAGVLAGPEGLELRVESDLGALREAGVEVAVDFTHPDAVMGNIEACIEQGIHVVVGTTGLRGDDLETIRGRLEAGSGRTGVFVAPNFAIGAVLMMRFAALAAAHMPAAEIIELHHDQKADAPSGTALRTAEMIAGARRPAPPASHSGEVVAGARGAEAAGVRIHSVRLPGLVAHQEVIFGGPGQTLSIRHDSIDRTSFMPGVLLAIRETPRRPGLTVGLEHLLGL